MLEIFLVMLVLLAVITIHTKNSYTIIVFMEIFSLVAAFCYLLLAAPDVAMAEAVVSTLATILLIVAVQKYLHEAGGDVSESPFIRKLPAFVISVIIGGLWFASMPQAEPNVYLKNGFLEGFIQDVGGENAVTAIYLGYRVYDTVFEALMLLVSIVAIIYFSRHGHSEEETSDVRTF